MAFKLGSSNRGFNIPENKKSNVGAETPIIRKSLGEGIKGEANNDGSIDIDKSVKPGSALENRIVNHEMQHMKDMRSGNLSYGDDYVRYNGKTYPRKDGKIKYNGKWSEEGSMSFPWERKAKDSE